MKYIIPSLLALSFLSCSQSPSYNDEIQAHRAHYKQEFVTDDHSPLKAEDTTYLRFFEPDESYRVMATLELTPDEQPFELPTYSGVTKTYRKYGILTFAIHDTTVKLSVYQSQKLIKQQEYADHLFVPFTDGTTYTETYGGGRYIDLSQKDVNNGKIELDFNKCYNPYCAYAEGYSCPIPPTENRLTIAIKAGEKLFGKEHNEE